MHVGAMKRHDYGGETHKTPAVFQCPHPRDRKDHKTTAKTQKSEARMPVAGPAYADTAAPVKDAWGGEPTVEGVLNVRTAFEVVEVLDALVEARDVVAAEVVGADVAAADVATADFVPTEVVVEVADVVGVVTTAPDTVDVAVAADVLDEELAGLRFGTSVTVLRYVVEVAGVGNWLDVRGSNVDALEVPLAAVEES